MAGRARRSSDDPFGPHGIARPEAAAARLAHFPGRGRSRAAIGPGLRSIPFARTVTIFYTIAANEVRIVRVLHARRDAATAFDDS